MKKLITSLTAMTILGLAAHTAQAQTNIRFGVKGGLNGNHTSIKAGNFNESGMGFGAYAGGLAELSFPKGSKFKLQLEANYNFNRNAFSDVFNTEYSQMIHSVQVPLSVKYFIQPDFSILAGLSANSHLAASHKYDNNTNTAFNDLYELNTLQLGAHIGANYYIKKGFFIEARYNYLFGSVMDLKINNTENHYKMGTLQLGVGYKF